MIERALIDVTGLVQGVGFRPFVHSLATSLDLRGFVQNRGSHLFVDVEGEPGALAAFVERLSTTAPPLAQSIVWTASARCLPRIRHFVIAGSEAAADPSCACRRTWRPARSAAANSSIPAIAAIVTRSSPAPRAGHDSRSSGSCHAPREYGDGALCHVPGVPGRIHQPARSTVPRSGDCLSGVWAHTRRARRGWCQQRRGEASLRLAVRTLLEGGILAVKGLGGYHLACDATSLDAVAELRRRKGREAKPLAVMFPGTESLDVDRRDLGCARFPRATDRARRSLTCVATLAPNIAANSPTIGVLLPYTPIHYLLLHDVGRPLVMTSGNRSDEPMVHDEDAALEQLADIADAFLTHDRRIDMHGAMTLSCVSRPAAPRSCDAPEGMRRRLSAGGTRAGRRSRGRRAPQEHILPGVRRSGVCLQSHR